MDNQKQIKEMREDIELAIANGKKDSWYIEADGPDWIAESLDHKGYRKIPENAVVLTREEYEKLCDLAYFGNGEEVIRKETAEKYHAEIENAIESVPNATKEFVEAWKAKNDEIAKEITEKGVQNGN